MMTDSPYKFLDFYGHDDQNIFFGREREINILVADILVNRLVVLFARTGTGKTSLINAGVRPRLEAQGFETFYVRVEQDPTEAARDTLRKENLLKNDEEEASLSTQLSSAVKSLQRPLVLFFDQFEEFFIQISDKSTRQDFIRDIAEVYRNTESGVHLVFSMREEYFHEMDEFRSEIPSIFHKNSNLRLLPLDVDQARVAIIGPAGKMGVEIEPDLTDVLIRDLAQEGGIRPTSLQIVCDTLWRNEDRTDHQITLEDYERAGGWRSILDQRLEQDIEESLTDSSLVTLMRRLIPELRTERNTKYPRLVSDLAKTLKTSEETLHDLVSRLKDVHIIREITISGANAIEWASDYLAERTESLLRHVKIIELKRLLQSAMEKAQLKDDSLKNGRPADEVETRNFGPDDALPPFYLSRNDFEQFSEHILHLTKLNTDEIEFLFNVSLFYQRRMTIWFDLFSKRDKRVMDILSQKIHNKEEAVELRRGSVNLLAELGSKEAIALLNEALDEPDIALEVMDVIASIPGAQTTDILARALERDDLWEPVVLTLTRAGTERAVFLLKPLLEQEAKFFQALNALERLAKSSGQVGSAAVKSLEAAIPILTNLLEQEIKFFPALGAVERLTKFSGEVGGIAEQTLVSAIPKLEKLLHNPSTSAPAQIALERLATHTGQVGGMAANALMQSQVIRTNEAVSETKLSSKSLSEKIEDLLVHDRMAETREVPSSEFSSNDRSLDDLCRFIEDGSVIPVISNAFRMEEIFRDEMKFTDAPRAEYEAQTVSGQLTKAWADIINYPYPDKYHLAQVAQYYGVVQRDSELAKIEYINFLKKVLLSLSEQDEAYKEQVSALGRRAGEMRFSDVVQGLDYPRFPQTKEDPLRLLAKLPLPIYITTTYFDFLERALAAEGKMPRTQLCFWRAGSRYLKREYLPDRDYNPTASEPAVYHLYGLEDYPSSLLLGEDDYMHFLINMTDDINSQELLPFPLRVALSEARLVLLGYRQDEWDFRVLFKFLLQFRKDRYSRPGIIVQPKPAQQSVSNEVNSLQYQTHYFSDSRFRIEWDDVDTFVQRLWNTWQKYMQG